MKTNARSKLLLIILAGGFFIAPALAAQTEPKVIIDNNNPNRVDSEVGFTKFGEEKGRKAFYYMNDDSNGAAWICGPIEVRRSNGALIPIEKFPERAIFSVTVKNYCVVKIQIDRGDENLDEYNEEPRFITHIEPRNTKVKQGETVTFTVTMLAKTPTKGTVPAAKRNVFFLAVSGYVDTILNQEKLTNAKGVATFTLRFSKGSTVNITAKESSEGRIEPSPEDKLRIRVVPYYQQPAVAIPLIIAFLLLGGFWFYRLQKITGTGTQAFKVFFRWTALLLLWVSSAAWGVFVLMLLVAWSVGPGPESDVLLIFLPLLPLFYMLPVIAAIDALALMAYIILGRPRGWKLLGSVAMLLLLPVYFYLFPYANHKSDNISESRALELIRTCKVGSASEDPMDGKLTLWIQKKGVTTGNEKTSMTYFDSLKKGSEASTCSPKPPFTKG